MRSSHQASKEVALAKTDTIAQMSQQARSPLQSPHRQSAPDNSGIVRAAQQLATGIRSYHTKWIVTVQAFRTILHRRLEKRLQRRGSFAVDRFAVSFVDDKLSRTQSPYLSTGETPEQRAKDRQHNDKQNIRALSYRSLCK